MKLLHISHNDLDGVSCGILVREAVKQNARGLSSGFLSHFLPQELDTAYVSYDDVDDVTKNVSPEYSAALVTDLSLEKGVLERLAGEREVYLIDHHLSSKSLAGRSDVCHSLESSAAKLTYDKLVGDGYDLVAFTNFVECVNDFDLWLLKREDSLRLNLLFSLLGFKRFEKRFQNTPYTSFFAEEELLIQVEEERRKTYIQKAMKNLQFYTDKRGYKFALIFAETYNSELGNEIIKEYSLDFAMIVNAQKGKCSLRSRKEVDVSEIAEQNGGGGHKNAAGFSMTNFDLNVPELLKRSGIV